MSAQTKPKGPNTMLNHISRADAAIVSPDGTPYDEDDIRELYADMLDELHSSVQIGECEFLPSTILRECDPVAYRVGLVDYVDYLLSDGWYDPSDMSDEEYEELVSS